MSQVMKSDSGQLGRFQGGLKVALNHIAVVDRTSGIVWKDQVKVISGASQPPLFQLAHDFRPQIDLAVGSLRFRLEEPPFVVCALNVNLAFLPINYHRPCRWFSQTATSDNVIRCCLSKALAELHESDDFVALERIV